MWACFSRFGNFDSFPDKLNELPSMQGRYRRKNESSMLARRNPVTISIWTGQHWIKKYYQWRSWANNNYKPRREHGKQGLDAACKRIIPKRRKYDMPQYNYTNKVARVTKPGRVRCRTWHLFTLLGKLFIFKHEWLYSVPPPNPLFAAFAHGNKSQSK